MKRFKGAQKGWGQKNCQGTSGRAAEYWTEIETGKRPSSIRREESGSIIFRLLTSKYFQEQRHQEKWKSGRQVAETMGKGQVSKKKKGCPDRVDRAEKKP